MDETKLLTTMWHYWYIQNKIVHHKHPPPTEASKRFLCSYLDSLITTDRHALHDAAKGKTVITYDPLAKPQHVFEVVVLAPKWTAPPTGWMNLNTYWWSLVEFQNCEGKIVIGALD